MDKPTQADFDLSHVLRVLLRDAGLTIYKHENNINNQGRVPELALACLMREYVSGRADAVVTIPADALLGALFKLPTT